MPFIGLLAFPIVFSFPLRRPNWQQQEVYPSSQSSVCLASYLVRWLKLFNLVIFDLNSLLQCFGKFCIVNIITFNLYFIKSDHKKDVFLTQKHVWPISDYLEQGSHSVARSYRRSSPCFVNLSCAQAGLVFVPPMCFCFVGLPFFSSASWPLSFLSLFLSISSSFDTA